MDNKNLKELSLMQEELVRELGLEDVSQEQKEALIVKMTEAVLKRIFLETLEKLAAEDQRRYEEMIDKEVGPEEMENFLRGKIENYDKMIVEIVKKFKDELKASIKNQEVN